MRKVLQEYDPARIDTARVGQLAPDFTLRDLKGQALRLDRLRGKAGGGKQAVVLLFLVVDH
jgi:peroxiredoxin